MNFIQNLFLQFQTQWNRYTTGQRVGVASVTVLTFVFVLGIGWWSSRPQYILLADNLSPSKMGELKSALDAKGIPNRMNFDGSGIQVPSSRWNEARVAGSEHLDDSSTGSPSFASNGSILSDPLEGAQRVRSAKEQSLEHSLMRFNAIEWADVQIAQPEWTPFLSERNPTTASVVLGIRQGKVFTAEHASTVVAMVARAVDGLSSDNITVTSLDGRVLHGPATEEAAIEKNLSYRRRLEADLAAKAEIMLSEMLGDNKAIVRVSADVDFTETTREDTIYDPDGKVKVNEIIQSSKSTSPPDASGIAGTASNTLPNQVAPGGNAPVFNNEKTDTTYANAKTIDTVRMAAGKITRLTVAAIVDVKEDTQDEGAADPATAAAPPNIDQTKILAVVKNAVGFDETRGDEIEVLFAPLTGTRVSDVPLGGPSLWERISGIIANASLGIAAIVALILGLRVANNIRPISTRDTASSEQASRAQLLNELSEQAKNNPELVSNILSAWLNESSQDQKDSNDDGPNLNVVRPAA